MKRRLYNTYKCDGLTLFELDRTEINNLEYLLLLQKEEPNIICVGQIKNNKLVIVDNPIISNKVLNIFMEDDDYFEELISPFRKKD